MPSPWKDDDSEFPFEIFSKYLSKPNSCFALSFELKTAPISWVDYQYPAIVGQETSELFVSEASASDRTFPSNYRQSLKQYTTQFEGHRLGGYPLFTQVDPRARLADDSEPYELLLQIDSDSNNKIDIL